MLKKSNCRLFLEEMGTALPKGRTKMDELKIKTAVFQLYEPEDYLIENGYQLMGEKSQEAISEFHLFIKGYCRRNSHPEFEIFINGDVRNAYMPPTLRACELEFFHLNQKLELV